MVESQNKRPQQNPQKSPSAVNPSAFQSKQEQELDDLSQEGLGYTDNLREEEPYREPGEEKDALQKGYASKGGR